ncbi:HAMP domain-containing methyl-accepting chemotaxis protein [Pseudovibrio exalbescens]|uniref:methyl-accepting chemotaxis protein n=1 Tax=Pseudovibrio exalbescens TaxID=197461 RepID=UPI0023668573|nr:HAMP domain-containing methyl-accepting chemotaxis protein [Pseudovibrio exalbescens]MDD7909315.1 HAMP domain-containing methyl-accepting chemotaxis protein [Pseudovibrio exalbescens]
MVNFKGIFRKGAGGEASGVTKPGLGAKLSLRVRILALCGIMVIGFGVIGGVFVWSQSQLNAAFERAGAYSGLSSAVRDVAIIAGALEALQKEYELLPGEAQKEKFDQLSAIAKERLEDIRSLPVALDYTLEVSDALDTLAGINGAFEMMHQHQMMLGFDGDTGLRGSMAASLSEATRVLKSATRRTKDPLALRLIGSLGDIQSAESGFILNEADTYLGDMELAYSRFDRTLPRVELPADKAQVIEAGVKAHRADFEQLTELTIKRRSSSELLANLFDLLPPRLDALKVAAEEGAAAAGAQLAKTTQTTQLLVGSAIVATAIAALLAGLVITSSIMRPLQSLRIVMSKLAKGNTETEIPLHQGGRELAAMANTLHVFRDSLIEQRKLQEKQSLENRSREERSQQIDSFIAAFEQSVAASLSSLHTAAEGLGQASTEVESAADNVLQQADSAGQAVGNAAQNVSSASAATEQLAMSINEIAKQAESSTRVAGRAVHGSKATEETMTMLSDAAHRIGEAVGLIRDIASQTNLLALNATIEAARAGEHGKGFAVVASEVKNLANQTSQTTEEIAEQVEAIQQASGNAVTAIQEVGAIIQEMNEMTAAVAASVEQQNAAVQSISENVASATQSSHLGAEAMHTVSEASGTARATGGSVSQYAAMLSEQADSLQHEVSAFLEKVRAA